MGLAKATAKQNESPIPLGEAAEELYGQMIREYPELGQKDFSSVYRYLEKKRMWLVT